MLGRFGQPDVGRYRGIDRTKQLGDGRANRGTTADVFQLVWMPTRETYIRVVTTTASDDAANHGGLVHQTGELRKDFADFDSWHIRFDRLELAANFAGSFGLDVPHVLVRRTTRQENVDDRLV